MQEISFDNGSRFKQSDSEHGSDVSVLKCSAACCNSPERDTTQVKIDLKDNIDRVIFSPQFKNSTSSSSSHNRRYEQHDSNHKKQMLEAKINEIVEGFEHGGKPNFVENAEMK